VMVWAEDEQVLVAGPGRAANKNDQAVARNCI
jgi:hypothetical protein